jgi:predicted dinucleotide-binding enzyme
MTGYALSGPRIAVLGAGHTGPVIARVATEAGYRLSIAASGDPEQIELITMVLAPGAEPRWAADAIRDADIVVLAIPLHRFANLDPAPLAAKIVVDTMNYWPPTDGVQPAFEDPRHGSSEIVQQRLAGSTVVKTLNHIGYHELDEDRRPRGHAERRALGVAGDDPTAVALVAEVIDRIGYDPVQLGRLRDGRLLEPGGPVFGISLLRDEFESAIATETEFAGLVEDALTGVGLRPLTDTPKDMP